MVDEKTKRWGYIDKSGQYRVNPRFKSATVFQEGLAAVQLATGEYNYINHLGESVITLPSGSHDVGLFKNGLAEISLDHGHGYVDGKGKLIWSMVSRD